MADRNWYEYYRDKAIQDTNLFERRNKKIQDVGKEFDRLYKIVKRQYGQFDLNLRLEKMTYNFVTGQKQRITARSKAIFEKRYTEQRLKNMAQKYTSVKQVLELYSLGYITLDELNDFLHDFKESDKGYLRNYGK